MPTTCGEVSRARCGALAKGGQKPWPFWKCRLSPSSLLVPQCQQYILNKCSLTTSDPSETPVKGSIRTLSTCCRRSVKFPAKADPAEGRYCTPQLYPDKNYGRVENRSATALLLPEEPLDGRSREIRFGGVGLRVSAPCTGENSETEALRKRAGAASGNWFTS